MGWLQVAFDQSTENRARASRRFEISRRGKQYLKNGRDFAPHRLKP